MRFALSKRLTCWSCVFIESNVCQSGSGLTRRLVWRIENGTTQGVWKCARPSAKPANQFRALGKGQQFCDRTSSNDLWHRTTSTCLCQQNILWSEFPGMKIATITNPTKPIIVYFQSTHQTLWTAHFKVKLHISCINIYSEPFSAVAAVMMGNSPEIGVRKKNDPSLPVEPVESWLHVDYGQTTSHDRFPSKGSFFWKGHGTP